MEHKIKEKIAEEQYKFYRHFFNKAVWFVLAIAYFSTQVKKNPSSWWGIVSIVIIWLFLYKWMNREHNNWMESIGGKDWREKYKSS